MSPLAIPLRFLQTQPDERLVALARDGHERAFEALVRRYRSRLLAYCRRVAPLGTPPEDILQQGLLQAWRALRDGAEVHDARAWLYRIVHNVAITMLRASGELPDGVVAGTGALGVEQIVEQRMAARDALAGLAALPDLQRQVMVSATLDGRSHEEIAAALGLSNGSVRGLIYRARSTLRAAAAAVIPAPVIDWALGDAGSASAGLAGAGSAGLGALILKGGGAILAVSAVAGTTAIVASHRSHHGRPLNASSLAAPAKETAGNDPTPVTAGGDLGRIVLALRGGQADHSLVSRGAGSHDGRSQGRGGHDGSGNGGSSQGSASQGGDGSGGSSDGGDHRTTTTTTSGTDGGGDHGATTATTTSGSDGGGDHGATTATTTATTTTTSGSDGGGDHGATTATTTSGSDGGGDHGATTTTATTTSGSDGGGDHGATTATSGSDGGSTSGSDGGSTSGSSDGGSSGGGSDGGSTTITTTTATTDGGH